MGYAKNILIGIDQLGNAIAFGNPDNTISARVGYNSHHFEKNLFKYYWKFLEWVIDKTFYPIDGNFHCHHAYHNDQDEEFYDNGTKNWAVIVVSVFIFLTCPIFIIILYPLYFLNIIGHNGSITIDH